MQTMEWTDGKLEERLKGIDGRFDEVNHRIAVVDRRVSETKAEINDRFDRVEGEVRGLRQEMQALHTTFQRGNFALIASVFAVLVATILKGG